MKEMIFSYKPIEFPASNTIENRISRENYINKMEKEGNVAFLKSKVISPFEESLKSSRLESLTCGEFKISISTAPSSSTSWKEVYDRLNNFLELRSEDSRSIPSENLKLIQGIGYCISLPALTDKIEQFEKEATEKSSSITLGWPKKKKTEKPLQRISLPDREYSKPTEENAIAVFNAKRFSSEIKDRVINPLEDELKRWFEANTSYRSPDKIPDKKTQHIQRTIEITPGSYIYMQLVREETPKYEKIITDIRNILTTIEKGEPTALFRHTKENKIPYVNISSVQEYLKRDNLEKQDLIKVGSRYIITP